MLILLLSLYTICSFSQVTKLPCETDDKYIDLYNVSTHGTVEQSSNNENNHAHYAIDGIYTASLEEGNISMTLEEESPWWEIDLGESYILNGIKIWYTDEAYESGLGDYYILFSEFPFSGTNLNTEISSPLVNYVHVETALTNGYEIPLNLSHARYIRIQLNGTGILSFIEIEIPGGGGDDEICDNGIDDDCDGFIDCADSDCGPTTVNVTPSHPACLNCEDGQIAIQAFGNNLQYSIDGGNQFFDYNVFEHLSPGQYQVVIMNTETGCSFQTEITLLPTAGQPNGCCDNGDFESGNFENWTGGTGTISGGGDINIDNEDIVDNFGLENSLHTVISENDTYQDPAIPELPIFNNTSGDFVARIGRKEAGQKAEKLTYTFEVKECNTEFLFNYLVVGQDPPNSQHGTNKNGFFRYRVYRVEDGMVIENTTVRVNPDDIPRFTVLDSEEAIDVLYTNWQCVSIDLSEYVGDELEAEFVVADCVEGAHWAYAYITGLCNAPTDMMPVANLNSNETYCSNQDILIDASESTGYSTYGWTVCELTVNNQEINCVAFDNPRGDILNTFDAQAYYTDGGQSFDCGKSYRASLSLFNDCTEEVTSSIDFDFICETIPELSYKDIINCGVAIDVMIEGENNCPACIYDWVPGIIYLNDPSLPFPTIEGSRNIDGLNANYQVRATNEFGCVEEEEVVVYNLNQNELAIQAILSVDNFCFYELFAEITTSGASFPPEAITAVRFINISENQSFEGTLVESSPGFWRYYLDGFQIPRSVGSVNSWKVEASLDENLFTIADNCILTDFFDPLEADDIFTGEIHFFMPNAFAPGDSRYGFFKPQFYPDEIVSNAFAAEFVIWARWGLEVHRVEVEGINGQPITADQIAWDGFYKDKPAVSEVYVYRLRLKNCDFDFDERESCPSSYCWGHVFEEGAECDEDNDCSNFPRQDADGNIYPGECAIGVCNWVGDVTLVR